MALSIRQPAGVCLGIAPWNAPVILGVRHVMALIDDALAKGATLASPPERQGTVIYGLSGAVFSKDIIKVLGVAKRLQSGICHINGPMVHDEGQMPFWRCQIIGLGALWWPDGRRRIHRPALDHHRNPARSLPVLSAPYSTRVIDTGLKPRSASLPLRALAARALLRLRISSVSSRALPPRPMPSMRTLRV